MSWVYGAEHLARLISMSSLLSALSMELIYEIVNLPSMISHTTMDAESVNILRDYVTELMRFVVIPRFLHALELTLSVRFLLKEKDRLFLKEYESAGTQYQNLNLARS